MLYISKKYQGLVSAVIFATFILASSPAYAPVEFETKEGRSISDYDMARAQEAEKARLEQEKEEKERERYNAIVNFPNFNESKQYYSIYDGAPDAEAKAALTAALEKSETAHRIDIQSLEFTTRPALSEIEAMLTLAASPLPGTIQVGWFLPQNFGTATKKMKNAWGNRPSSILPYDGLQHSYLSNLRGNTLIVIGHVEGENYVLDTSLGKQKVSIKQLLIDAHENQVVLIPIGCRTAEAGVGWGFIEEIDTDTVSKFLENLPYEAPTVADLMKEMSKIGKMRVNIRDAANLFQVQAIDRTTDLPVIRVRIPYNAIGTNTTPGSSSQFQSSQIMSNADSLRPLQKKTWFVSAINHYAEMFPTLITLFFANIIFKLFQYLEQRVLKGRWPFDEKQARWVCKFVVFLAEWGGGNIWIDWPSDNNDRFHIPCHRYHVLF